jgi:hypothetical protein
MFINTEIPVFTPQDNVTGCCPVFHPEDYENKLFDFSSHQFIKAQSKSIMYVPMNLDKVMTKTQGDIVAAHQNFEDRYLIISQDVTPFKCDHYFIVKGEVPHYPIQKIEGLYYTKVYDGSYNNISKWMKDLDGILHTKGRKINEVFAFYSTCPKCAEVYKHNYVVLMAKVDPDFEI